MTVWWREIVIARGPMSAPNVHEYNAALTTHASIRPPLETWPSIGFAFLKSAFLKSATHY